VRASAAEYEISEKMHHVCFHYEFEHDPSDPDEVCAAGGCPSGALAGGRDRVERTIRDLAQQAADGAAWENTSLTGYLDALAGWLADSDGYYFGQGRVPPSNAWETINDAVIAATTYE
jgi:hypothetical protein